MESLNDLGDYLNTEIVCTLAGLGYSEGSDYYKSPDCLGRLITFFQQLPVLIYTTEVDEIFHLYRLASLKVIRKYYSPLSSQRDKIKSLISDHFAVY